MAYRSMPKFNPEARFVANRAFLFNGHGFEPGDVIQGIPPRRLRQLFEVRNVRESAPSKPASVARKEKGKHGLPTIQAASEGPLFHSRA